MIIFDGKKFAADKEEILKQKVLELKRKSIFPKLVAILVGDNPASVLYTNLKKQAAERIGVQFEIVNSLEKINDLNNDKSVHGIMIQLPLPLEIRNSTSEILNQIASEKDVDGQRENSKFLPATVKAILQIIPKNNFKTIAVVGSKGAVGSKLIKEFQKKNFKIIALDKDDDLQQIKNCDVVISATGVPNLITANLIKDNAIVIDVGSPKGDVDFAEVSKKVSFITPVPGGVGPVTIISLMENLVEACFGLQ